MNKRILLVLLVCCVLLSGCVKREPGVMVGAYFAVSTEKTAFTDSVERAEIEIPRLPLEKTCHHLILRLSDSYTQLYHTPPMDTGIGIKELRIEDEVVYIVFDDAYDAMSATKRAQSEMCITLTLCELEGVEAVNISTERHPNETLYTEKTFVTSLDAFRLKDVQATLYFPSEDGTGLVAETRTLQIANDEEQAEAIIRALLAGRRNADGSMQPFTAEHTQLLSASVIEPVCYVDLSQEFLSRPNRNGDGLSMTLYAFVNSLAELDGVEAVQFTIDGQITASDIAPLFTHPITPLAELVIR